MDFRVNNHVPKLVGSLFGSELLLHILHAACAFFEELHHRSARELLTCES